ncbi:hypothetical protein AYL99_00449 [Fonsecaea erecta]|uniref:TauD/TfdA-like domain-containing protein n=1 Tax=Fonsecaea erecta TaxID=1367422 RepID=A0A178ZXQ6_9EURO|nr:hypothetical protein AYL99_00449 [Fonsecaea erecta]OAP64477.1 hypothetical protein AYL99_00449 [Fonsecaea erecta]
MAPAAISNVVEPGYVPSVVSYEKLRPYLQPNVLSNNGKVGITGHGSEVLRWVLTNEDREEIDRAIQHFKGLSLRRSADCIDASSFPLPTLGPKLRELSRRLEDEQDYCLLLGFKADEYSTADNIMIQAGVCSYVGNKRGMAGGEGGDKNVVHHITPLPASFASTVTNKYHGPPNTTMAMPFHTDAGQIVSLYTIVGSKSGGRTYLASTSRIVEEMAKHCPDLIPVLVRPWSIIPTIPGAECGSERPLLFYDPKGKPIISCSRARITGTPSQPRPRSLPPLSEEQMLALDALHYFGQAVATPFDLETGHMLFFNNMRTMHARDKIFMTKWAGGRRDKQRHLTRLILRDETRPWYVPEGLRAEMSAIYDHEPEDEEFQMTKSLFSWEASH